MKKSVKRRLANQLPATTTSVAAQKVIDTFPSFKELISDDKYGSQHLLHPIQRWAFTNSLQWEGIAMAVNNMLNSMYGKGFYDYYAFNEKRGTGSASVLPAHGDPIKVDFLEFQALTLIMFIFNMGCVEPTDEQYEAYLDFKSSDTRMWKILD
jgi:hypothetical protein